MNRPELAVSLFRKGFSCSQAVLAAFAETYGLPKDQALKISQPFGGGIARLADWCGAVTGAFLVIGLEHGRTRPDDFESRDRTYNAVRRFLESFRSRNGQTSCRDLLGCDIGTPEGMKKAEEMKLHETRCEQLVRDAVEILEEMIPPEA